LQQKLLNEILDPELYLRYNYYIKFYNKIKLVYSDSISSSESVEDLFSGNHLVYFEDSGNYCVFEVQFHTIYYSITIDVTSLSEYEYYFIEDFLSPLRLEFFGPTDRIELYKNGGHITISWWFEMKNFMIEYDELSPEDFFQISKDIFNNLDLIGKEIIYYAQNNWQDSYALIPKELCDYFLLRRIPLSNLAEDLLEKRKRIQEDKLKIYFNKSKHQDLFYEKIFNLIENYRQGDRKYR